MPSYRRSYYYAGTLSGAGGTPSGEGRRVAMRQGGTLTWLFGDHLGSTTITATENGTLASEQKYTAWGQTRSGSVGTDRQYTGQISEPQLGLYFYNARFYDPYLARFIQADTIIPQPGNPLAWDRYSYTYNNPINFTDPSGHNVCSDDGYCGNLNSTSYWNVVINDLSSSYGITFSGSWSIKDKVAAMIGVIVVAGALSKHSDYSAADTFLGVFGRMTFSVLSGTGAWFGERVSTGISFTSGKERLDPRLMAHELGHSFNAMYVNRGNADSPYNVLGKTTITDSAGNWLTGLLYDSQEGVTEWVRGYDGYPLSSNGDYDDPELYHGPVDWEDANSVGEEYADMFMNWSFNSFLSSAAGIARYNWMSRDVQRALSVMQPSPTRR